MRYPITFSADMKYLSNFYNWTDEEKGHIRAAFTDSPSMVAFFERLAAAHRAGYEYAAADGFQRLQMWCKGEGILDPFGDELDPVALDASSAYSDHLNYQQTGGN